MSTRLHGAGHDITLAVSENFAHICFELGMKDKALQTLRDSRVQYLTLAEKCDAAANPHESVKRHEKCFHSAERVAAILIKMEEFDEAKSILREQITMVDESGEYNYSLLRNTAALLRRTLAKALLLDGTPSLGDLKRSRCAARGGRSHL